MKPLVVCLLIAFSTVANQAYAKDNCSVFMANLMGLEWALENCEQTPKIKAWMKEERERIAEELKQKEKEAAAEAAKTEKPR